MTYPHPVIWWVNVMWRKTTMSVPNFTTFVGGITSCALCRPSPSLSFLSSPCTSSPGPIMTCFSRDDEWFVMGPWLISGWLTAFTFSMHPHVLVLNNASVLCHISESALSKLSHNYWFLLSLLAFLTWYDKIKYHAQFVCSFCVYNCLMNGILFLNWTFLTTDVLTLAYMYAGSLWNYALWWSCACG